MWDAATHSLCPLQWPPAQPSLGQEDDAMTQPLASVQLRSPGDDLYHIASLGRGGSLHDRGSGVICLEQWFVAMAQL